MIRLPIHGLVLVLFGQAALAAETTLPGIRGVYLVVMGLTLAIHFLPWRVEISSDRARVFATIGIVGYVIWGFSRLNLSYPNEGVDAFFRGLVLVFTAHQLGAMLRIGAGGDAGPVYVVSAVHITAAANAQGRSQELPWLLGVWAVLALYTMRVASAPRVLRTRRRWMTRPLVLSIVVLLSVTVGLTMGLPWLQRLMQGWHVGFATEAVTGFSAQSNPLGQISSMKRSDLPVMRVWADSLPSQHLRAMTYQEFEANQWRQRREGDAPVRWLGQPLPVRGVRDAGYELGPIPGLPAWAGTGQLVEIAIDDRFHWPNRPAPLGTTSIHIVGTDALYSDAQGILQVDDEKLARRYVLQVVTEPRRAPELSSGRLPVATGVNDPGSVNDWAQRVGGDESDPLLVAIQLERWFADSGEFEYSRDVPKGYGVVDFLAEDGRQGWCEYFATAMALMLRSRGVECRYVTGYICQEWNPIGQYYLVREWDAHAWVEANIPGLGWRTFDPTPPDMRRAEGSDSAGAFSGFVDWVMLWIRDSWARLETTGPWALFLGFLRLAAWVLFVCMVGAVVILVPRLDIFKRAGRAGELAGDFPDDTPEVRSVRRAWRRVLEGAEETGIPLQAGETPRAVALQLADDPSSQGGASLERLVELIYRCRYGGAPLDPTEVEEATRPFLERESR